MLLGKKKQGSAFCYSIKKPGRLWITLNISYKIGMAIEGATELEKGMITRK